MGSEPLESCPVCGAECNVSASYFEPGANVLCDRECGYFIHCAVDRIPAGETHECQIAEVHNTLARRAEIGRIVEEIVDAKPGLLTIGRTPTKEGVTIYSAWSSKPFTDERSLLEALRALAAKLEELTDGE